MPRAGQVSVTLHADVEGEVRRAIEQGALKHLNIRSVPQAFEYAARMLLHEEARLPASGPQGASA